MLDWRLSLVLVYASQNCARRSSGPRLPLGSSRRRRRATRLTVVSAGPNGEVAELAQANEIRVVFSEPMVVLGKIPQPLRVPFVRIAPAIGGTFRWSGTTVLIFTPEKRSTAR